MDTTEEQPKLSWFMRNREKVLTKHRNSCRRSRYVKLFKTDMDAYAKAIKHLEINDAELAKQYHGWILERYLTPKPAE
jgi:hypothetical protein